MTSRPRLADLPFLAATLAMMLALVLPWAFNGPAGDEREVVEIGVVLPWAVPEPAIGRAPGPDLSVQLAGQAGPASGGTAQP
ncbi:hypothetical protein EJV46_19650 [Roseococcus sp. SYP-B2431]|uniref:hypothetical protein n=1 Tax=Roseococcus sp. SYP-B2431 TaxID=2496640 RepID=UPI001038D388|nr:hypothetical protein [Roseococcus sp. SYP-B2431]TCH96789.1 hypothetical protein EJV46_19650 [Roseococcus sp. SYP-B2431]